MFGDFWRWLFLGLDAKPGYRQFKLWWTLLHLALGVLVAVSIRVPIYESARAILLPLTGLFIGLSFSWLGNAQALLQQSEIERLARHHPDGIRTYAYTFQLAVLVVMVTLVAWGLAGLKLADSFLCRDSLWYTAVESLLYFLVSVAVRECWHVVMGSQALLLARISIRQLLDKKE